MVEEAQNTQIIQKILKWQTEEHLHDIEFTWDDFEEIREIWKNCYVIIHIYDLFTSANFWNNAD